MSNNSLATRMSPMRPHPHHLRQCQTIPTRVFFLRPSLTRSTTSPRIVCMAEPYLIIKLESAEKTWKELSVKLADQMWFQIPVNIKNWLSLWLSLLRWFQLLGDSRIVKRC